MKLDYKLHIYMGYYFELSSSNTCISNKKWSYRQSPKKTKNNGKHKQRKNITT